MGACAGPALDASRVEDARAAYDSAQETASVFDHAASSMRQAREHLRRAEELLDDGDTQEAVDHHAFLARHHVAIAEARLRRGLAQDDIDRFEQRRQALLLEARQQEASQAVERLRAMEDELADTRMQLRLAEQRAKALAERLVELGVTDSVD